MWNAVPERECSDASDIDNESHLKSSEMEFRPHFHAFAPSRIAPIVRSPSMAVKHLVYILQ